MLMYALYETATGKLISASRLPINNPKPDVWSVKEVEGPHRVWNTETLQFDDFPTKPRMYTQGEFLELFTDIELENIMDAAKLSSKVAVAIKRFDCSDGIVLTSEKTIRPINTLRDAGLLTAERATQILGGGNV